MCHVQRLTKGDMLGRLRLKVQGLKLSQRCLKYVLYLLEVLGQPASAGGPQPGCKGKSQPIDVIRNSCGRCGHGNLRNVHALRKGCQVTQNRRDPVKSFAPVLKWMPAGTLLECRTCHGCAFPPSAS